MSAGIPLKSALVSLGTAMLPLTPVELEILAATFVMLRATIGASPAGSRTKRGSAARVELAGSEYVGYEHA